MSQQSCFQCGLPVPGSESHTFIIDSETQQFCCLGCKTVAQLINDNGLIEFYQFRSNNVSAKTADIVDPKNVIDFSFYDESEVRNEFVADIGDGKLQAQLYIDGIHCTACTWLIEQFVGRLPAVSRINVNSATHTCLLEFDKNAKLSEILHQFVELGYQPKPSIAGQQQILAESENKMALLRLAVAGFAMMQVGMFAIALYAGALSDMEAQWQSLFRWVSLVVATPVVVFSAQPFFIGARRALLSRHLTMDVPVALAIGLAFLASCWATMFNTGDVYFDSVSMFTFFLLVGRYLEMRVRHKNEEGINQLVYTLPPYAMRLEEAFDDAVRKPVPLNRISVGEYLWVKEGEVIAVDGLIVDLSSSAKNSNNKDPLVFFVNESMLTGEAIPIQKTVNDVVLAGTINMDAGMIVRVTAVGSQTRLSAIQKLMNDALHQKPQQVSRADKISGYFVGFVLLLSIIVALSWYFIDPARAFWITLSVLVVTCPCALSLATPVSITAAIYRLRQLGLLVTKAHVIEALDTITHVVFDKTGTLTTGSMSIIDVVVPNAEAESEQKQKLRQLNAVLLAARLEQGSSHPIAKVFEKYLKECLNENINNECTSNEPMMLEKRRSVIGSGIEAVISGGHYRIGKKSFVDQLSSPANEVLKESRHINNTSVDETFNKGIVLGSEDGVLAVFTVSDSPRPEAKEVIQQLESRSLSIELLSGDNENAVKDIADELAISHYRSDVSPEEKLAYLNVLQKQGAKVLMLGDGLNDLPVLSGADVSIAMSSASDLAQVQADSVLLRDDLGIVPRALDCVRLCQKIIRQNLTWAVAYNIAALPLAAFGFVPPYAAAIGMSLSSLIVVLNATRIYRFKMA